MKESERFYNDSAKRRRILFVYKEDYPWDVRVEKILNTLNANCFDVSLLCRNKKKLPVYEVINGIRIHRLTRLLGKISDILSTPFYINPIWFFSMLSCARKERPQILIIRDLPLMIMGVLIGKLTGAKVIFDMAECYPEMYASSLYFSDKKIIKWITRNPNLASLVERLAFRYSDLILVMIEESRDRALKLGALPEKLEIVSNTPVVRDALANEVEWKSTTEPLRLFYVGFITRIRGIDNTLYGMVEYLKRYPNSRQVEFYVVGVGQALSYYKELTKKLGLSQIVTFYGWCEQDVVDDLYSKSDVGILGYHVCGHWNNTIPNKLFDYMYSRMPVLSSDVVPIKRIIEDIGCGLIFRDNDPEEFSKCLKVLNDNNTRRRMGECGYNAVMERYNWSVDSERLVDALNNVFPPENRLGE